MQAPAAPRVSIVSGIQAWSTAERKPDVATRLSVAPLTCFAAAPGWLCFDPEPAAEVKVNIRNAYQHVSHSDEHSDRCTPIQMTAVYMHGSFGTPLPQMKRATSRNASQAWLGCKPCSLAVIAAAKAFANIP